MVTTSKNRFSSRALAFAFGGTAIALCSLTSSTASAQSYRGDYRGDRYNPAAYGLEADFHFSFAAENVYGNSGAGAGVRLGIPLAIGSLGRLPSNLALSFGGDVVNYQNCYYADRCNANYVMVPVAAQWNLWVAPRVSIFGEAGAFAYRGWFDGCAPGDVGCNAPRDFGILPTLAVGARVRFGYHANLIARLGYPTTTIGISFM
jgi:hypothetical protein